MCVCVCVRVESVVVVVGSSSGVPYCVCIHFTDIIVHTRVLRSTVHVSYGINCVYYIILYIYIALRVSNDDNLYS